MNAIIIIGVDFRYQTLLIPLHKMNIYVSIPMDHNLYVSTKNPLGTIGL